MHLTLNINKHIVVPNKEYVFCGEKRAKTVYGFPFQWPSTMEFDLVGKVGLDGYCSYGY